LFLQHLRLRAAKREKKKDRRTSAAPDPPRDPPLAA
jgi:hypothetical protein